MFTIRLADSLRETVSRYALLLLGGGCLAAVLALPASAQIPGSNPGSQTSYLVGPSAIQDIAPIPLQRGAFFDGSLRSHAFSPGLISRNPFGEGWNGNNEQSSTRLDIGTFVIEDVDLALPSEGYAWVIGRTYNARQDDDSSHHDSNGPQGRNWFQTSQMEIVFYDNDALESSLEEEDMVYIIYGADRFIAFKRTADDSVEFNSVNGAAGAMLFEEGTTGEPDTYTYFTADGIKWVFFGFDTDANPAAGQLWKVIVPKHPSGEHVSYVGDPTTGSTAISNGFDANGLITIAHNASGTRFTYTYTTYDSVDRLTRVKAEVNDGSWIEIGRVDYDYYRTGGNTTYGDNGCLEQVTVTLPLSDSGVELVKNKHYRYWKGTFDDSTNPGHPYALKYIVEWEGTRNYDYSEAGVGEPTLDDGYLTATENDLKAYAATYFEYDSSHRVDKAWYNGACGCSGASSGTYEFEYETNGSYSDTSGYDDVWASRTTITRPDGSYEVKYFDEMGGPLHSLIADGDPDDTSPEPNFWVTEVDRDSNGLLTEIRSPAVNTDYTHSTATITASTTAGVVTTFSRVSSGDAQGLVEITKHKTGTNGTAYFDRKLTYASISIEINGANSTDVVRPLISTDRRYETETSTDTGGIDTTFSYAEYSSTLRLKKIETTLPAVTTGKNGSGNSNVRVQYLRLDGTTAFTEAEDDIFTYMQFTDGQLTKRIDDAKLDETFASGDDPNTDWGITENSNGLDRTTTMTYDDQGRLDETTLPDGRVTKQYHSVLDDGRAVSISIPKFVDGAPDTFYGPAGYSVSNHAGRGEFSGSIALSGGTSTTALSSWIDEADDDPITALDHGTLARMSTSIYDEPGTTLEESRSYFDIPGSGEGSEGTNFDATKYTYNDMGQTETVEDPTGTIHKTVFDAIGRASESWVGTINGGGSDNMKQISEVEYDSAGVGNGLVTERSVDPDGAWGAPNNDIRTTTFEHDVRGRVIVQNNPTAPHILNKYDNMGRMIAVGQYSSTSGLDPTDDPTSLATNRMALSQTFYDEMSRVWKSQRHEIDDADGSDDDNLQTLNWYDEASRLIKTDGDQLAKMLHDRLGRMTHQFILAEDDDIDYDDVLDSTTNRVNVEGDIVMEEHQTVYESSDSDNVIMSVAIERLHDDYGGGEDTGTLDTNADGDDHTITQANVAGRVQITAMWYDDLDRIEDTVFFGTFGGSDFDRDSITGVTTADPDYTDTPIANGDALLTERVYNDDGTLLSVTDPDEIEMRSTYDDLGRQVTVIANYINGTPSGANGDDDVHTRYEYTNGLQTKIWVDFDGDGAVDTTGKEDQETTYSFGVSTADTPAGSESDITVNNLLRTVTYPDAGTVIYAYNALSQQKYQKDQNGTILENTFDDSGRETVLTVSALGTDVDGWMRRIETAYDSLGRQSTLTQYDATTSGNVLNEVKFTYGGWGEMKKVDQDHNSTVATGGNHLYDVDYTYANVGDLAGRNTIRMVTMDLPSGKRLTYGYAQGSSRHDDPLSRVSAIKDDNITLVRYDYLGVGHTVGMDCQEADVMQKRFGATSGSYPDLDRFNRLIASRWTKDLSTDVDFIDFDITFDRNSNITLIEDNIHVGFDVAYTIDDLNRLTDAQRGTWNGSSITSETRQQTWILDQVGNWEDVTLDFDNNGVYTGTDEYDDDRTHNKVNELIGRDTDDNGTDNHTLVYSAAGELTDDGDDYEYTYDALGRLVLVEDQSGNELVRMEYNALGHRTRAHYDTDGDGTVETNGEDTEDYFFAYNERWQLLAVYEGTAATPLEEFSYHHAGLDGRGGSSYIDDVLKRWRDTNDETGFDEAVYYCHDWRHSVVAIVSDTGKLYEQVRYSAYGDPFGLPAYDSDSNGAYTLADTIGGGGYDVRRDPNLDGVEDAADKTWADSIAGGFQTLGRGVLSSTGVQNRKGLSGYENDHNLTLLYHVRHRVLHTELGRWTKRDPLGYVDGMNLYAYARSHPATDSDPTGLDAGWHSNDPCRQAIHNDCWTSKRWGPTLRDLRAKVTQSCGRRITYRCSGDCPAGVGGRTWLWCFPWPGQIIHICKGNPKPIDDPKGYCGALVHEFTHALQNCNEGLYERRCRELEKSWTDRFFCMQYEMEAYFNAGQCNGMYDCCTDACASCRNQWSAYGGWVACFAWCEQFPRPSGPLLPGQPGNPHPGLPRIASL